MLKRKMQFNKEKKKKTTTRSHLYMEPNKSNSEIHILWLDVRPTSHEEILASFCKPGETHMAGLLVALEGARQAAQLDSCVIQNKKRMEGEGEGFEGIQE